jgi:hypothetical protein
MIKPGELIDVLDMALTLSDRRTYNLLIANAWDKISEDTTHCIVSWSPKFEQVFKLGSLLRRTDLDDEQTEAVFGRIQGEGGTGGAAW